MNKVLAVVDRLEYTGRGRQARDLYRGLAGSGTTVRLCVLGRPPGIWAEQLRQAGVEVEPLAWNGGLDLRPWQRLRAILYSFAPQVVHAWGLAAARLVALCGWRGYQVASPGLVARRRLSLLDRLDRRLLSRFQRLILTSEVERQAALALGLPSHSMEVVLPGYDLSEGDAPVSVPAATGEGPVLLSVGDLVPERGHREALWALDVLRYVYRDARLVIVGTGPERGRLEQFTRRLTGPGVAQFVGEQAELGPWLARAQVVWCPVRRDIGHDVALAAMAHGRPVIATSQPGLAECVHDGATGLLVPPRDPVELARVTRLLLDDPSRAATLAAAGRQAVAERFSLSAHCNAVRRIYHQQG